MCQIVSHSLCNLWFLHIMLVELKSTCDWLDTFLSLALKYVSVFWLTVLLKFRTYFLSFNPWTNGDKKGCVVIYNLIELNWEVTSWWLKGQGKQQRQQQQQTQHPIWQIAFLAIKWTDNNFVLLPSMLLCQENSIPEWVFFKVRYFFFFLLHIAIFRKLATFFFFAFKNSNLYIRYKQQQLILCWMHIYIF